MASHLCHYDVRTGLETVVYSTDAHVEAPNWTSDGALIVNGGGRLFRVSLAEPVLQAIDTHSANRLNNDHGLSPDGRMLAISNHTVPGQSCIYVMPVNGGEPRQVTAETPSWFHAWAPDGRRIAYAAARGNRRVRIATCGLDGSDERILSGDFDHADGPDYSADGKWIWFNGEVERRCQLYRMRPDGSDLQQMTDDERVNWFPHPDPMGHEVVYLSYPPGTEGHPGNLPVELKAMPQEGGPSRVLLRLHGGQGTINVPSWEPGGKRFAFVRYDPA